MRRAFVLLALAACSSAEETRAMQETYDKERIASCVAYCKSVGAERAYVVRHRTQECGCSVAIK